MASAGTKKPLWKRVLRFIAVLVAIKVLVLAVLWVRWRWSSPVIAYNPLLEYRAEYENHPHQQRAWDLLRDIGPTEALVPAGGSELEAAYPPKREDAAFEEGKAFVKARAREVGVIREASDRAVFGFDYNEFKTEPYGVLLEAEIGHLTNARACARLLMLDARVAFDEHDLDRGLANIRAIFGLSRLLRVSESDFGKLTGTALTAVGVSELSALDQELWDSLTNEQLVDLAQSLAAIPGRDYSGLRSSSVRALKEHIQRVFSDNGHGDGHFCAEGVVYLADVFNMSGSQRTKFVLSTIVLHPKMMQRREAQDAGDAALSNLAQWLGLDPWERPAPTFDQPPKSLRPEYLENLALLPIYRLSAIPAATGSIDLSVMQRDAARIAIAAELYRRKNGEWPKSPTQLFPNPADVPLDAFSGKPLQFSIREGRPFVYSVGNDRDDDGGRRLPLKDGIKAALWKPVGDPDIVDADYVLFPNAE
jgi:hypothetical protein